MNVTRLETSTRTIQVARVVANDRLCKEHYRLTLHVRGFTHAVPGQFVHINPPLNPSDDYQVINGSPGAGAPCGGSPGAVTEHWKEVCRQPILRRAFSIAGFRSDSDDKAAARIDIIYRVVGTATRWMQTLACGDGVSLLGPLGNAFPIDATRPRAWLIAGGVGLPPLLWLCEALHAADIETVAFLGAQAADLIPLSIHAGAVVPPDGVVAPLEVEEFAATDTRVVISTDDGSVGYHGHVGQALAAFHRTHAVPSAELTVYTCGPERMMRFVAEFCRRRGIICYACMERAMACGTGTCQSCVVEIRDDESADGWRYDLCCMQGPVFDVADVVWG